MALFLLWTTPQAPATITPAPVPGTYDILICKSACSFASAENILVRGTLVLEAAPFQPPDSPFRNLNDMRYYNGFLTVGDVANSCFVLEIIEPNRTYAGSLPAGFTNWSVEADAVRFKLYASPDASFTAKVYFDGENFRGVGTSDGVGGGAPGADWKPTVVAGRRAGPVDRSICLKAVEKQRQQ